MAENEIPPIPVPPIEPAPVAPRPAATVMPPLVNLANTPAVADAPAAPGVPPAESVPPANPYVQSAPAPSAAPNPYVQPNPYAPVGAPNPYVQQTTQSAGAPYSAPPAYGAQPYGAQPYGAQPYGGPGSYAPSAPKGLALTSMILGLAAFVLNGFGLGFVLGILVGAAAVVTGHLAQRRQAYARAYWITGLISGYIAAVFGLIVGGFWIYFFAGSY